MDKIKRFCSAHKFFFCFYALLLFYSLLLVNNAKPGPNYYMYHCVDFSMGFCTRLLPGSIYHFLVGIYSRKAISNYVRVLLTLFLLLVSILCERVYLRVEKKYKPSTIFLFALLVLGPLSLSMYAREMGILDFYWAFFFVISFLLLDSRIGKFFIPIFIFLMVLTHYASIICYVPALLLIILYLAVTSGSKSEKTEYAILFVVGLAVALVSTGYFALFERNNLTYSVEEFNKILDSRGADFKGYFDFVFYRHYTKEYLQSLNAYGILDIPNVQSDSVLMSIINYIVYQFRFNLKVAHFENDWFISIVAIFIIGFLVWVFAKYLKTVSKKSEKVAISLMLAFFPFVLCGWLFSADFVRWLGTPVVLLIFFLLAIVYYGRKSVVLGSINKLIDSVKPTVLGVFMFIYAFLPYSPYN